MSFLDTNIPRDIPRRRPSFASNLAHSVESWSSSYARSLHYMSENLTGVPDDLDDDDVHQIVYGTTPSPSSSITRPYPPNLNTAYTEEEGMPDEQSSLLGRKASIYSIQSRSSMWSSATFDEQPRSTFAQSLINSVNILIGIALLSFPLALKNAGWLFGAILLAFTCLLTNYTAKIIARCLEYPKATRELKTYADMAGAAYGMQGRIFISTVFMLELIAASVALIVLFADSLHILFPTVDTVTFKILAFLILTPTTYLAIRHLSYTSFVGILSSFTLVAVVCYDGATKMEHPGSLRDPMPTSLFPGHWMTLPLAFGQMAAGFAGHATFPSVYRDMAHPEDFNQVVNYTYLATSLIYAFMAASGYLMFGKDVLVITENMMQTPGFNQALNKLAVWLIVINPFTKYALTLSGVNFTIELSIFRHPSLANVTKSKVSMRLIQFISRLLVSSLVILIAILFPAFDRVIFGGYDDEDPFAQTMGGFGLGGFMNPNRGFSEMYRCYSIAMMQSGSDRDNVSYGGKIILPQSALEKLSRLNISYPMLFKLINAERGVHTHAGVLEFIAEEGRAYLPHWMMQALQVEQGEIIEIKNTSLPLGTFVRIQPQSVDFLDISDPKAVLENAFRNFATLTQGDIIQIIYNNKIYEIKVLEIKPIYDDHGGISIMETDLEVDFAPPVGYVEPSAAPQSIPMGSKMIIDEPQTKPANAPFQGSGQTLKSRAKDLLKDSPNSSTTSLSDAVAESAAIQHEDSAIPAPLNLPFGQLYFGYPIVPLKSAEEKENEVKQNFSGAGQTLRAARKAQSRQGSGTSSPAPQSDGKGKGTR